MNGWVMIASGDEIIVHCDDLALSERLFTVGFQYSQEGATELVARVNNDLEKGRLFSELRGLGIPFSRGREWSPAEVFEYLRDKGVVSGEFDEVVWRANGRFVVRKA